VVVVTAVVAAQLPAVRVILVHRAIPVHLVLLVLLVRVASVQRNPRISTVNTARPQRITVRVKASVAVPIPVTTMAAE